MNMRPEIAMARAAGLERFEAKGKAYSEARRKIVVESGELDNRRFLITSHPEVREELHRFRDAVVRMGEIYPEIIGSVLYGSRVKGYANSRSDLDAYILIDADVTLAQLLVDGVDRPTDAEIERRNFGIDDVIRTTLREYNLSEAGLGSGIGIRSISSKQIEAYCTSNILNENNRAVMHLFQLGVGKGIYHKREEVIAALEAMDSQGEAVWTHLMDELWRWENQGFDEEIKNARKRLYPKTLAEGRQYFLSKPGGSV